MSLRSSLAVVIAWWSMSLSVGAAPPRTNVPPALEIEVLDPGVDPLGNPAVQVKRNGHDQIEIDIPPVLLVLRYYYSGDRSFQGPMLPGGPSIVVANHPRTGERCYVPVQMMPGAPVVNYTGTSIEFDYGTHGATVCFRLLGKPVVKYRNAPTVRTRVNDALRVDELRAGVKAITARSQDVAGQTRTTAYGMAADASGFAKTALLPVRNVAESLPLGKIVFDGNRESYYAERAQQHQRDKENRRLQQENERRDWFWRTNR